MKILAVKHAVPHRRVTNNCCREAIAASLNGQFTDGDRVELDDRLQRFFEACGTETRYIRESGERALDFVLRASRDALDESGLDTGDIDFLIYCGVGRGWIEPAMANVVQSELKLAGATCFDILDACASWLRALQVSHSFLKSGVYRRGMIVNCECSLENYLHMDFQDHDDFDRRLASFTIGEAATATIVTNEVPEDDFYFSFKTFGQHFDLCMIPLGSADSYLPDAYNLPYSSSMKFFAESKQLVSTTVKKVVQHFRMDERLNPEDYDIVFTHAASEKASQLALKQLGIPTERFFGTHPQYGNTVSASVPLAMSLAEEQDRLHRGDRVLVLMGSAGISVGFSTFTY